MGADFLGLLISEWDDEADRDADLRALVSRTRRHCPIAVGGPRERRRRLRSALRARARIRAVGGSLVGHRCGVLCE